MALQDLLRALREQAAERREREIQAARRHAERIRAESRSVLEHRRSETAARTRREEEERAHRGRSRARAEAAAVELAARDRLLARVRAALEGRIAAAGRDASYLTALPTDLEQGLGRLPEGRVVVRATPELLGPVTAAIGGRPDVEIRASDVLGAGYSALVEEAGVEADGTLSARLEHAWPRLAVGVLHGIAS